MRIVICINPRVPLEHAVKGRDYSERTIGASYSPGDINDDAAVAAVLRELADVLTAPATARLPIDDPRRTSF